MRNGILLIMLCLGPYFFCCADPWGKDADLASMKRPCAVNPQCEQIATPILGPAAESLIWFHQNIISPADGPRSNFIPSSSQYTLDAMRAYGFFKGFTMGCDRLMRENADPWVYPTILDPNGQLMKWDPIP